MDTIKQTPSDPAGESREGEVVTSSTVARHIVSSAHPLAQTTDVTDKARHVPNTDRFSLPQVA